MKNQMITSILNKLGVPNLNETIIATLSFSEIQSLLLDIVSRKTQELRPQAILAQYLSDGYVRPSTIDQRRYLHFDAIALSCLPDDYSAIELSPVSPLGCCSQIAHFSQKRILSTIRKNEVSSDPTNVLAFEASRQKGRNNPDNIVKLATSQRVTRSERMISKDTFAHFKLFCACIAGYDRGNYAFELCATRELLTYYARLLAALQTNGYAFSAPEIVINCKHEGIYERFQTLKVSQSPDFEHLALAVQTTPEENWNYYASFRFKLFIHCNGERYFIADGGDTDWTQQILNNRKERFLISGLGSERFLAIASHPQNL